MSTHANDHPEDRPTSPPAENASPETQPQSAAQAEQGDRAEAPQVQTDQAQEAAEQAALVVQLQSDLMELQNRALRAQAELDNFRKRVYRQMEEERKYAHLPLLQDLLPVLDNLQRAIDSAERLGDTGNGLLEGVRLVVQQWIAVLEKHHCTAIEAKGTLFDPHVHEAIAQIPNEQVPAGAVVEVTQKGYLLRDRVVRPAAVVVSAGPPEAAQGGPPPTDESPA